MTKMSTIKTNSLSIGHASNIVPNNFIISERRPSMNLAFFQKLLNSAASGCNEQRFSGYAIIVCCFFLSLLLKLLRPRSFIWERVTAVFGIMSIEITNSIGCFKVTTVFQILLWRFVWCPVSFFWHYLFISINWIIVLF